jgi:hypothetical protein
VNAGWVLLLAAPPLLGLAAWLWRRRPGRRDPDSSTGGTDVSDCATTNRGSPWSADSNSDTGCSSDGGGDGGGCGDGGGGD